MPNRPRIWTGFDADVFVYLSDAEGNRQGPGNVPWVEDHGPAVSFCYFENINLDGTVPAVRRPVTGRPERRITVENWEYELSVGHLYFQAAELPVATVFSREQVLELVLQLKDPYNPEDVELRTLKIARCINFQLSTESTSNVKDNVKFLAEKME